MLLNEVWEGIPQMLINLPLDKSLPLDIEKENDPKEAQAVDSPKECMEITVLPELTALDPDLVTKELKRRRRA